MTRRPIVAGNWKEHKTISEASALASGILKAASRLKGVEVILCPPFTALSAVGQILANQPVTLGAQNCHWEPQGAFTGEVSPVMLKEAGARYCIVGHSERRALFGETNEVVARKLRAVLAHGLTPILCIGETLDQRRAGQTVVIVEEQLRAALANLPTATVKQLVLAYEPVWAIGTGQNATPEQAQEIHAAIRQRLAAWHDAATAQAVRIQYGGSVKPDNSESLISQPDIDGFLVGGASLQVESFMAIVTTTDRLKGALCTSSC